ncbi:MAG: hypothetical protein ACR2GI_00085, partial [Thermomicrobiales bacterium]
MHIQSRVFYLVGWGAGAVFPRIFENFFRGDDRHGSFLTEGPTTGLAAHKREHVAGSKSSGTTISTVSSVG